MSIYSRIKNLASEKKISIRELESQLGFSNGTLRQWKDSTKSASLEKVADYFGVTVDYLLGKTNFKYTVEGEFYDRQGNFNPISKKVALESATYNQRAISLSTFDILNNLELLNGNTVGDNDIDSMLNYINKRRLNISDLEKEKIVELTVYIFDFLASNDELMRKVSNELFSDTLKQVNSEYYKYLVNKKGDKRD